MKERIDFDTLDERGPQTLRGTFDVSADEIDREEFASGGSVTIELQAEAAGENEYDVNGSVAFTADLSCSRCADPYPFANTSGFHIRFRPHPQVSSENEEIEITGADELDVEFTSERSIPLRELAIEQIQLLVPMKPLCDENCLGLCPQCGANRSRETCSCEEAASDPRWDSLRGLREQLAKKHEV